MLLNFDLPVYEVRAYFSKTEEGKYIVLQTRFSKYVLDCPSLVGDYADRRLQLLSDHNKPYKLYPLRNRISTLSQLLKSKNSTFITEKGELIKYKKNKYYDIVCKRVVSCTQIYNGKYQCYLPGINTPFVTRNPYEYLSVIELKNSYVLFDVHTEKPEKVRYRIKI
ncbi:hypothetical protein AAS21_gp30 [Pantoea phage vB_PagS_AAS21]|uniref:Uncharacterized protein n=1 Tax=Pantoea phage vB_PagS_AAS21 TaxID=2575261 RepID=A0A4Y5P1D5_9CAUD|nr:hypothetical protein AAS21_gp30 [Pantoea phage vB_PagS_AAS21]